MRDAKFFQRRRDQLTLYATPPHECSYLPPQQAVTLFLDPAFPKNPQVYGMLSRQGFRRSGEHIYRPQCSECQACVAVRVPVAQFAPRRSQRRIWEKNRELTVREVAPLYCEEHFNLYARYLSHRHRGGGMDAPTPQAYLHFLTARWADTRFYEFRRDGALLGVAVADRFVDGLSSVYNFFHPDYERYSLGVYMVLWEIAEARRLGLDYLYLGYWIRGCRKMQYKIDYQPMEYLAEGEWRPGHAHL